MMRQITLDVRAVRRLLLLLVSMTVAAAALAGVRSAWAEVDDPPLPEVAFLARADNPVDALAAGGLAGQLGAPVYLTFPAELGSDAAGGLAATGPDVVVLAGGTAALSDTVRDQVVALLPEARVVRIAGATRTATAVALSGLPDELGFSRPVLTGATVPGDVGIAGELTVDGVEVAATLAQLTTRIDSLESDLAAATGRIGDLEATLAGVVRTGDLLTLTGMNVQVTNGAGLTDAVNGLGNLIIGYNEDHVTDDCRPSGDNCQYQGDGAVDDRSGSHMLVIGVDHGYTSFGGIVAGHDNTTTGQFASVTGGQANAASGSFASVTGGRANISSGVFSSVTGGHDNLASGNSAVISGGHTNVASSFNASSVSGGRGNTASGAAASVSGGESNTASGNDASVSGGGSNVASGFGTSVAGGHSNTAAAFASSVAGGRLGTIAEEPPTNAFNSRSGDSVFADG